ncbi:PhnD/SsuA/transferrin family substrate-binding protein [Mesobacterium sp. TK19101]|uniref:PhnD/SsuA/transferrin family substrate-binding protein n=1 Tax=Mesobacterium hydrothermale TaxID=3111907 RepID=A0ABU6HC07_9RHOB|nr:PhnD/SsuA/transferrin family substrate-binding protein [Mesobacterium sp. TK19101]MEC3860012.1 PhnD/SsuA/transferrin family substrate-binding protein [Mesobacterium sp. TK19101]
MIVSLPMYDRPETAAANDVFWGLIREALGYGPERLNRALDPWEAWEHPDLLLSQTCGLPYRTRLQGKVSLIASPDFGLPDCPPGYYNSVLVARADDRRSLDDLAAARVVINQDHSQSGFAAIMSHFAACAIVPNIATQSGGHAASARMVAEGAADLAAIDGNTWRMIQAFDPWAGALREIERTAPTPAMPYITGPTQDAAPLRAAMVAAVDRLPDATRALLGLRGITLVPPQAFLAVPTPKFATDLT